MFTPNESFLGLECEHCHLGIYTHTLDNNDWWVKCNNCDSFLFCYEPMDHQAEFHRDHHKFRMYAGGFGSAKTSTCAAEMIRAALETPNGVGLVGAQTYPQLENTAKLEFKKMLTTELIENESIQKNYIDLINGYRVLFRSFDDEGKIRSLNLCHWWIEEASEVSYDIFSQLQTRLRNNKTEHHFGILSTNPDLNWIRTKFLLVSDTIVGSDKLYIKDEDVNRQFSTHIAKTSANTYLPPDYVESISSNKPEWWVERYLNGSFEHTEGAVYPTFKDNIVQPFEIPENWERLSASDFGYQDPTVMLMGAIDHTTGTVYIYDEHYENQQSVPYHAKKMRELLDDCPLGLLRQPVADPSGKRKSERDRRSLYDHYAEYGIHFKAGNNKIADGIAKVFSYFQMGKLKIFETCRNTVREGINYKYPDRELDSGKNADENPIDKDNHSMDCVRYLCQELPDDPSTLINHSINPNDIRIKGKPSGLPFALQEEDNYSAQEWYSYY